MIWCKTRSHSVDHKLVDSVRGLSNVLEPNQTRAESTGLQLVLLQPALLVLLLGAAVISIPAVGLMLHGAGKLVEQQHLTLMDQSQVL